MDSVCVDLFAMPTVEWKGQMFDNLAICVNWLSVWMVATTHLLKGLTAAKVAEEIFRTWWQPLGIPTRITSDQGPQWAGAWWRTLCSLMGLRCAYA